MKINKVVAAVIVFWLIILVGSIIFFMSRPGKTDLLTINNIKIKIERAETETEKKRGLCCRDQLDQDSGMLFIYDKPSDYRFWMKDTRIPLDMYWISSDKKIVHIEKNVKPSSYPNLFGSDQPAQYILETNAGFADSYNIKEGDSVEFNL